MEQRKPIAHVYAILLHRDFCAIDPRLLYLPTVHLNLNLGVGKRKLSLGVPNEIQAVSDMPHLEMI